MNDPRLLAPIAWLQQVSAAAGGRGVLVPVSGGSDGALCFWLCARALPGRVSAVYCGSSLRCREWFEAIGPVGYLPAPPPGPDADLARWSAVLGHARRAGLMLAGTRNRTEEVLGTYSLASRLAVLPPLAGLWKSEVMELAAAVGVPDAVLASSARPDPDCGRPAELAEITFGEVDAFLRVRVGEWPASVLDGVPRARLAYLASLHERNRFKAALPLRPGPAQ